MQKSILNILLTVLLTGAITFFVTKWWIGKNNHATYQQTEAELLSSINQVDSNITKVIASLSLYGEVLDNLNQEFLLIQEQNTTLIEANSKLTRRKKEKLEAIATKITAIEASRDTLITLAKQFEI